MDESVVENLLKLQDRIINTLGHEFWHAIEQGILTNYANIETMVKEFYKGKDCSPEAKEAGIKVLKEFKEGMSVDIGGNTESSWEVVGGQVARYVPGKGWEFKY